jgi:hypothetical protein
MFQAPAGRKYHKSTKRKQIDPTTCERDYTSDELEFMQALDRYKQSSGRKFPTCSEILEVVRSLGYQRPLASDPNSIPIGTRQDSAAESAQSTLDQLDEALRNLD